MSRVKNTRFELTIAPAWPGVTVSVGGATCALAEHARLLRAGRSSLYAAKRHARYRVICESDAEIAAFAESQVP
jgi:hypothetical protein